MEEDDEFVRALNEEFERGYQLGLKDAEMMLAMEQAKNSISTGNILSAKKTEGPSWIHLNS